jgi:hypothetical protein
MRSILTRILVINIGSIQWNTGVRQRAVGPLPLQGSSSAALLILRRR